MDAFTYTVIGCIAGILAIIIYYIGDYMGKREAEKEYEKENPDPYYVMDVWDNKRYHYMHFDMFKDEIDRHILSFFVDNPCQPYTFDEIANKLGMKKKMVRERVRYFHKRKILKCRQGTFYANKNDPKYQAIKKLKVELIGNDNIQPESH